MRLLRKVFPKETRRESLKRFPGRSWWSIEGKARKLGLRRPSKVPISRTLYRQADIGYSAGMIMADGSVMERLFATGSNRGRMDGGGERLGRWYSMPYVEVSMEDVQSLNRLGRIWGSSTIYNGKNSVGNDVWRVHVCGKKAYDLLRIVLPYLAGKKRSRAIYILKKYGIRTSLPVERPAVSRSFEGLE
jgi:hypothetical protein